MLLLVKVNVAVPAPTAVTTPAFVTVAMAGLLLAQVPPVVGDSVVVPPIQMLFEPVMATAGNPFTVTDAVGAEVQPVLVLVKLNVTVPAAIPSTTPPLVTDATAGLLLAQVPPVVGDKVVVEPIQILFTPVMLTMGEAFTVTAEVGTDGQPVSELVKMNVTDPADTPVTTPAFVTVATAGLLLAHVPPVVGVSVVVLPTQMLLAPVTLATGKALTVTGDVATDTQPVVVLVKVNVTVPSDTAVTNPPLVTVATAGLLLIQVPPEVGDKVVVEPTQTLAEPVILTTGMALTVTGAVGAETHPVVVLVKVNVAVPADRAVTTPPLVTEAIAGLLLAQVPPLVGDSVVVAPTQMLLTPVILTTGRAFTVIGRVTAEHPLTPCTNVKVTVPALSAVTTPALVTVAMAGLLLLHIPPVTGDTLDVPPTQILLPPVMLTTGNAFTVTGAVGAETQPLRVLVKVNVATPAETPVTTPPLVTVATAGLLLDQVPPMVGDRVVVAPTQIVLVPVILPAGVVFTVIAGVGAETQPVAVLVKVNVAVPAERAVTTPAFVTEATAGLLLTQVPPLDGDNPVIPPMHKLVVPMMLTMGVASTVTGAVAAETQPVVVLVKINVAVPAETPVTIPALLTVATAGLVLTHVPPVLGEREVVNPIQILLTPVILTVGVGLTVTAAVGVDTQPVVVLVNVNVAVPADTPVTTPALVTVATAALLLVQEPPLLGESPVVEPTQILFGPLILTAGRAFTVMAAVGADTQPVAVLVNVKLAVPAETPVTTPALVTVATDGSLLTHTPPLEGDKEEVLPTQILADPVILVTSGAFTVTAAVGADSQPVVVLVNIKVAVPAETPVTTPAFVTVATDGFVLIHIPLVGVSVVVNPIQILLVPVILTGVGAFTVTAGVGADEQPVAVLV